LNSDLNLVALGVRAEIEVGQGVDFVFAKHGFVLAETELP